MSENRIYKSTIQSIGKEATYVMSSSFRMNDNHSLKYIMDHYETIHIILYYQYEKQSRNVNFILPFLENIRDVLVAQSYDTQLVHTFDDVKKNLKGDIVLDKEYLKEKQIVEHYLETIEIPHIIFEDNVCVPVEIVSPKEEYSARTIRPKIHKHLYDFMDPVDMPFISIGESIALQKLQAFITESLPYYDQRNHPELDYTSHLSVYLKYGLISPIRILYILDSVSSVNKDSFIEELVIRRELSYNFIHYNKGYDQFNSITYEWAYQTMNLHLFDHKEHLYTIEDYINYKTHDPYFNAAMKEMIELGRMHGYMRMYWCKKIIEWSPTFEEAYTTAIYLNNYYFLDGNTPNGYTGIAWCFGKHDRAWTERPIFGKLRYMNSNGLKRKFDIEKYIDRIEKEVNDYETR